MGLTAVAFHRGDDEPASAHTGKAGPRHQLRDALAANRVSLAATHTKYPKD
jgi:hypothetical protein